MRGRHFTVVMETTPAIEYLFYTDNDKSDILNTQTKTIMLQAPITNKLLLLLSGMYKRFVATNTGIPAPCIKMRAYWFLTIKF